MGAFLCSGVIGLLAGVAAALWYLPKSGQRLRESLMSAARRTGESLQAQVESVTPTDSVAESIARGKAAARRRRDELGLDR
jgi:gas vesicle protein